MITSRRFPIGIVCATALVLAVSWANHGRADAPAGHYTITNGTVFDTKTSLTWQQTFSATTYSWSDAQTYCAGLALNGTGWRVPSMKELQTIVAEKQFPAIDLTAFPGTTGVGFWTSSQSTVFGPAAWWVVVFDSGYSAYRNLEYPTLVRCVR